MSVMFMQFTISIRYESKEDSKLKRLGIKYPKTPPSQTISGSLFLAACFV